MFWGVAKFTCQRVTYNQSPVNIAKLNALPKGVFIKDRDPPEMDLTWEIYGGQPKKKMIADMNYICFSKCYRLVTYPHPTLSLHHSLCKGNSHQESLLA